MNTRSILFVTALLSAVVVPAVGQHEHMMKPMAEGKTHDMSMMMGTPTFEKTANGIDLKVWLITQEEHHNMMKEMDHDTTAMSKKMTDGHMEHHMMKEETKQKDGEMGQETMNAMMAGTHHIMVEAIDAATKQPITKAIARMVITSPSNKTSSVELKSMRGHFGGGLTLADKGSYVLTLRFEAGGETVKGDFSYVVK